MFAIFDLNERVSRSWFLLHWIVFFLRQFMDYKWRQIRTLTEPFIWKIFETKSSQPKSV